MANYGATQVAMPPAMQQAPFQNQMADRAPRVHTARYDGAGEAPTCWSKEAARPVILEALHMEETNRAPGCCGPTTQHAVRYDALDDISTVTQGHSAWLSCGARDAADRIIARSGDYVEWDNIVLTKKYNGDVPHGLYQDLVHRVAHNKRAPLPPAQVDMAAPPATYAFQPTSQGGSQHTTVSGSGVAVQQTVPSPFCGLCGPTKTTHSTVLWDSIDVVREHGASFLCSALGCQSASAVATYNHKQTTAMQEIATKGNEQQAAQLYAHLAHNIGAKSQRKFPSALNRHFALGSNNNLTLRESTIEVATKGMFGTSKAVFSYDLVDDIKLTTGTTGDALTLRSKDGAWVVLAHLSAGGIFGEKVDFSEVYRELVNRTHRGAVAGAPAQTIMAGAPGAAPAAAPVQAEGMLVVAGSPVKDNSLVSGAPFAAPQFE